MEASAYVEEILLKVRTIIEGEKAYIAAVWRAPLPGARPCERGEIPGEQHPGTYGGTGAPDHLCHPLAAQEVYRDNGILFAPTKAANDGGVAESALEMSQNAMRVFWEEEDVDRILQEIMKEIHAKSSEMAKRYGGPDNLVMGANIAGFVKVADALIRQGI